MAYRIGIDLGGTAVKIGVVDEAYRIVYKHSIATGAERPYAAIVADIATGVKQALSDAGIGINECKSAGIGSPGLVDTQRGVVMFAGNLGFEEVPIAEELQKYIALPVFLSNDANCAAYGEALAGSAQGTRNSVLITLGTGIGGGIILNGKIYTGGYSAAAEIGHMVLVPDGEPCTCGARGCFEAYASATALIRQARRAAKAHPESVLVRLAGGDAGRIGGDTVFAAASQGDAAAKQVLAMYIRYLSIGIVGIANILRPDVVLIGGGISNAGDVLIGPVNDYVKKNVFAAKYAPGPPVRRAALGNDAGIIGAAMLDTDVCM